MTYLKKAKKILLEYWEILVAIVMLLIGVIIGTSGNREKVSQEDANARKKASSKIQKGTDRAIKNYHDTREKIDTEKKEQESKADQKKEERKEELLNDSSSLDKVLKEKYGLKGE